MPTPTQILKRLDRLRELRSIGIPSDWAREVHQNRLLQMARQAAAMNVWHLRQLEPKRRYATLVAVALDTMAMLTDQILEMHNRLIGLYFKKAERKHLEAFQEVARAINEKVNLYAQIGRALVAARGQVRTLIDFAPAELALAPRPLEGELTSSWLYRVAAANLVEMEELLSGLIDLYPEVHGCTNICLDYGIAPAWSRALAVWCRLPESRVHTLDLTRVFPGRDLNWFVHGNAAPRSGRNSGGGSVWWLAFTFCPRCLHQQVKNGVPVHRCAEWTLAFLTHCPEHQDEPLRHYCLCCHREEPRGLSLAKAKMRKFSVGTVEPRCITGRARIQNDSAPPCS